MSNGYGKNISGLIIGGSGVYNFQKNIWGDEIDCFSVKTPFGESNPVHFFRRDTFLYGLISRHGESGYEKSAGFVNYRANIYAAKHLGVKRIVTWSGPGAISPQLRPGMLFLPDDLIDFTKKRDYTFFEKNGLGFIRQSHVFCPELFTIAMKIIKRTGVKARTGGVYVCTEGPRLETSAEIRAFKNIGGDAVGMTIVPEVFLARELEMCYLTVCYIANYAEGVKNMKYKRAELFEGTLPEKLCGQVKKTMNILPEILFSILFQLKDKERNCPCASAMLRYRKEGRIGDNWMEWIK